MIAIALPTARGQLHPCLESTLQQLQLLEPEASLSKRVEAAWSRLLESVSQSTWPEVAWAFSSLTGSGFPVELSLSSMDEAFRYTVEVGGPELPACQRLARCQQLLQQLNAPGLPQDVMDRFIAIQNHSTLTYGAWMSGRHTNNSDRYKVYAEIPQDAPDLTQHYLDTDHVLTNRATQLRMVGYDPTQERIELYYRVLSLEHYHLFQLLRRVDLQNQQAALDDLIRALTLNRWREQLPGHPIGFSYSLSLKGEPPVFALFTFARSLCGRDSHIRQHLLNVANQKHWPFTTYQALTTDLTGAHGWQTAHGMMAFISTDNIPPFVQIGISPC